MLDIIQMDTKNYINDERETEKEWTEGSGGGAGRRGGKGNFSWNVKAKNNRYTKVF